MTCVPDWNGGVGDGAAVGVGVDQHDLVVPAAASKARLMAASSRLVGNKRAPAEAGGTHGVEGLLRTVPLYVKAGLQAWTCLHGPKPA